MPRASSRLIAVGVALASVALAACGGAGSEARALTRGHLHPWTHPTVVATRGVSTEDVRTAIKTRIAGAPPAPITVHQWHHVQTTYARFSGDPLWLTNDGLDRGRVAGLLRVLADADKDALDLSRYPLADLNRAVTDVDSTAHPSAEQLARADVLLTAAYVAFSEDVLVGQVDPSGLSQSWHIPPSDERNDSALIASLKKDPLDEAIAAMRPQDSGYVALQGS